MPLFQKSVLTKHIKDLDKAAVTTAYTAFKAHFHNTEKQQNIRDVIEIQYQEGFLKDLFVDVLGYTLNPNTGYNLTAEKKNETDAKKADGAILSNNGVLAVIELKDTGTINLDHVETQAFGYKHNQRGCRYVVTSNFEKLRFYIDDAVESIEWNLFTLSADDFAVMYLCLHKDSLLNNIPLNIKTASVNQELSITKKLYKDYSTFKRQLYQNIVELNPQFDKVELYRKTQKLLDRFLFLLFAEDKQLLPPNSIREILDTWDKLNEMDEQVSLYSRYRKFFGYMNTGDRKHDIFAYNGGLFAPDEVLDNIRVDDQLLYASTHTLSQYDFETEVDVNILGHIFEHSLNDIDAVTAESEGRELEKDITLRKKDGVFYTPKYITKYIVENTLGKLCEEKKIELDIKDEDYAGVKKKKGQRTDPRKPLNDKLETYSKWLLQLTILDPACGSGAFLNQALDFLIAEHRKVDELRAKLFEDTILLTEVENHILENNLYGVDLNDESIEIAKLSLWLRTAKRGRKLSSLNNNIKCGNSLIDDAEVVGDKAFKWEEVFSEVFVKGGFDVVIGNPPYGAFIGANQKEFLGNTYNAFQGNYEIYFFFIELLGKLLMPNGNAGYITPDTWINIPQAQKLREYILAEFSLSKILTFSYSVFEDASVNAIITILTKNHSREVCEVFHVKELDDILSITTPSIVCEIENWRNSTDKQFQIWQDESDILLINKITANAILGELMLDVCQGIVPYSTEHLTKEQVKQRIYHSATKLDENYGLWVQGRAIGRYSIYLGDAEYLKYGKWLHRSRMPKYFSGERILIQEITGGIPPRISAQIFSDELYHDPGIISCINISNIKTKYLLAIINSKLISWYNIKTAPKGKRKSFPKVLISDIRRIPFKIGNKEHQEKKSKLVDNILILNNEFQLVRSFFIDLLQSKFDLPKLSNKLQEWYLLDYKDFLKELTNAKAILTLAQEAEWLPYFTEQKAKALELKNEIDRTDKEIDRMVYELYDLTEEEIAIVEGA